MLLQERAALAEERRDVIGLLNQSQLPSPAVSAKSNAIDVPAAPAESAPAALRESERAQVCISYQSADLAFMKRVRDGIEAAGFVCADGSRIQGEPVPVPRYRCAAPRTPHWCNAHRLLLMVCFFG